MIRDIFSYLGSDALYLLSKRGARDGRIGLLRRSIGLFDKSERRD